MHLTRSAFLWSALIVAAGGGRVLAQSNYATPYTFTTLAGTPNFFGAVDGTGTGAKFNQPHGVGLDGSGNLYVADGVNSAIRKVTPAGVVTTFAGVLGVRSYQDGVGPDALFNGLYPLAVDGLGNIYVGDGNIVVRKISPARVSSTLAGNVGAPGTQDGPGHLAHFASVLGLAVDAVGNLYVADSGNHTIRKVLADGTVSTFAGTAGVSGSADGIGAQAKFQNPRGLAVDAAGNVYVADAGNNTIRKITPGGSVMTLAGSAADLPGDLDATGTAARFKFPTGVAVDAAGNVFVADSSNRTVRKISPTGVVTTLGGVTGVSGGTDGAGSVARFYSPSFVAVDGAGNLYVSDEAFHTIRVGAPPQVGGGKIPGINIPLLIPPGATAIETRALTEQPGGGVLVAISGAYAVRPNGNGSGTAQALSVPNYTNPQPYNLSYVVRLLANGQPDPTFTSAPGAEGTVNAFAVQTDGKIVVGGTFTKFNAALLKNIARLKADGTVDATFNTGSGFDAQVNAVALQADGAILVGGTFQTFQGLARPYLVRLNSSGAPDTSFTPALNGTVNVLALQPDGRILVGGNFTTVGGTTRPRIARLLASGANDSTFDPGAGATGGEVVALLRQSDGKIVAAGDFTSFAGQTRGIVRVLPTGAIDSTFLATASANGAVLSIGAQTDGKLLLGGAFTQVNGTARNHLARLLVDGTVDPLFDPADGANKDVRAVLPRSDGTVFLGGLFDQYQGAAVNEVVAVAGSPVATSFTRAPQAIIVNVDGTARFVAEATGVGALSYQWFKDGVAIAGATSSTLTVPSVSVAAQGRYTLQITSASGSTVMSSEATLTVVAGLPSHIINLSVLTSLDAPDATFTLGFVIGGAGTSGAKPLLVRAAGPSLAQFGVGNPLADPKLQFFAGAVLAGENDNWGGATALGNLITQVGAFPYTATTSKDAAFAPANLTSAANSVVVTGVGSGTGAVIAEVYDASPVATVTAATPRLLNVSVLKAIPAGATLTAGFVIGGNTTKTVLIRAIGPTLAGFGVGSPMADPALTLFLQNGTVLATNDNWNGTEALKAAFTTVGAFSLESTTRDAALLVNLPPGSYTAAATSANASAGSALVEVYEVP